MAAAPSSALHTDSQKTKSIEKINFSPTDLVHKLDAKLGLASTYLHEMQKEETQRMVISDAKERLCLMQQTYEFRHPGINAMVYAIQRNGCTCHKIADDCRLWIGRCAPCQ